MTKYRVYSTVMPEEKWVTAEELQHYKESDYWRTTEETKSSTLGANVQTDDPSSGGSEAEELALADPKDEYQSDDGETLEAHGDSYYVQNSALLTDEEREALQETEESEVMTKDMDTFWSDIEEDCREAEKLAREKEKRQSRQ